MASGGQKRITREFADITSTPLEGINVSLVDEGNVHKWKVVMDGPANSPYAGGKFELLLDLPTDYPFKPPKLNFKTKIWHPNVTDDGTGSMCLGILKGDIWKPSSKITSVLSAAQQLLVEPVPEDGVNTDAADAYRNHKGIFEKRAKDDTKKYAN